MIGEDKPVGTATIGKCGSIDNCDHIGGLGFLYL